MRRSKTSDASSRLLRLEIEDFGLIERATLEFSGGLTVFTGETGSGKTMLLGALAFVLGGTGLARRGTRRGDARAGDARSRRRAGAARAHDRRRLRTRIRRAGDLCCASSRPAGSPRDASTAGRQRRRSCARSARSWSTGWVNTSSSACSRRPISATCSTVLREPRRWRSRRDRGGVRAASKRWRPSSSVFPNATGRARAEFEFAQFGAAEIDAAAPARRRGRALARAPRVPGQRRADRERAGAARRARSRAKAPPSKRSATQRARCKASRVSIRRSQRSAERAGGFAK